VLILGDMFELGEEAAAEHEAIVQNALNIKADQTIFIGSEFAKAGAVITPLPLLELSQTNYRHNNSSYTFYKTADEAIDVLKTNPIVNSTVLIKGSRGMALERLVGLF